MTTEKDLADLSPEQEKKFSEVLAQWSAATTSTRPIEREVAVNAVSAIYAQINEPTPTVIFCQSPLQMALIPMLLELSTGSEFAEFKKSFKPNLQSIRPSNIKAQLWTELNVRLEANLTAEIESHTSWTKILDLKDYLLPNTKPSFEERFLTNWTSLYKRGVNNAMPATPPVKMLPGEDLMSHLQRIANEFKEAERIPGWQQRVRHSVVRKAKIFSFLMKRQLGSDLTASLQRKHRMSELWL